ncbi:MAG: MBL fold metallo-hydrolase [Phycisphaerales bacterium JB050]
MRAPEAQPQLRGGQDGLFDELARASGAAAQSDLKLSAARTRLPELHEPRDVRFAVLASSSAGNCSVLVHGSGKNHRLTLIDCGISPRRTRVLLDQLGLDFGRIDDVVLTHLDRDHCYPSWTNALPKHARFRICEGHRGRARRTGLLHRTTEIFRAGEPFELGRGVRVRAELLSHDDLGVAAFRFDLPCASSGTRSLGYATDLGRPTPGLIGMLMGVDVLAIESNYCPVMQRESDRPEFLKSRIMDGSGHLSNEECLDTVRAISPRERVVLLHLSRQCNTPELASRGHEGGRYELVVAEPDRPTAMFEVARGL